MTITLRPSIAADLEWIAELRAVVLREDLERLGRFDATRVRQRMRDAFVPENTQIIVADGVDVGCVSVRREATERWLEHFYLVPEAQGRGIGSEVLARVLDEPSDVPFRLNVLVGSSARRLYERFGFVADSEDDVDVFMTLSRSAAPTELREAPAGDGAHVVIRASNGPQEYSTLVDIWRSAVRATHDFLAEADFARIESHLVSDYFPAVTLTVAERDGNPVGFAGVHEDSLEMLFVADSARGQGVGSALLTEVVANQGVRKVDVNEQNDSAHAFYVSRGFARVGRSALDGDGRPYPTIHMEL